MESLAERKLTGRDVKRLETRERVFQAAVAEFKRSGVAATDLGAANHDPDRFSNPATLTSSSQT